MSPFAVVPLSCWCLPIPSSSEVPARSDCASPAKKLCTCPSSVDEEPVADVQRETTLLRRTSSPFLLCFVSCVWVSANCKLVNRENDALVGFVIHHRVFLPYPGAASQHNLCVGVCRCNRKGSFLTHLTCTCQDVVKSRLTGMSWFV